MIANDCAQRVCHCSPCNNNNNEGGNNSDGNNNNNNDDDDDDDDENERKNSFGNRRNAGGTVRMGIRAPLTTARSAACAWRVCRAGRAADDDLATTAASMWTKRLVAHHRWTGRTDGRTMDGWMDMGEYVYGSEQANGQPTVLSNSLALLFACD